jgi:glucosamine 6-phosphate synthetase-like amidotransferase/phosphosugar isomerase protein
MHSIGHVAVACLGTIDNLSGIQETLFSYGYKFETKNVAKTLCYLFSNYLKLCELSPIQSIRVVMNKLQGHFALMVLVAKGKWLMVGSRDYTLAIGKDNPTVYFGTDTETLNLFSSSVISVSSQIKPSIFCATSLQSEFQSDIILPVPF